MKHFDEDFRKKIVELFESGKSVSFLSQEYGVSKNNIYPWIRKYGTKVEIDPNKESLTPEEMKQLQKENARLKLENEILKKAVLIIGEK